LLNGLTRKGNCDKNDYMNNQIIAVVLDTGGKLISELIRNRPRKPPITPQPVVASLTASEETFTEEGKAQSIEAGCVPCAIGHFGTCSGLLNEGMRFARDDGIESSEVSDRVNMCLDELNIMERVDLRPELIADLPDWEKKLAERALTESRTLRHNLEEIATTKQLELVAATTQTARQEIGRGWFKERLFRMSPQEKKRLTEKAVEKLEKEEGNVGTK